MTAGGRPSGLVRRFMATSPGATFLGRTVQKLGPGGRALPGGALRLAPGKRRRAPPHSPFGTIRFFKGTSTRISANRNPITVIPAAIR